MIQISMTKLAELLTANGINPGDIPPELAAQVMAFNKMATASPELDIDTFRELADAFMPLLIPTDDAPKER